jgi:hypothetical protein
MLLRVQQEAGIEMPINIRGFSAILSDRFPDQTLHLYVAGFKEDEQLRDKISTEIQGLYVTISMAEPVALNFPASSIQFRYTSTDAFFYKPVADINIAADDPNWVQQGTTYLYNIEVDLDISEVTDFSKLASGFRKHQYIESDFVSTNFPGFLGAFTNTEKLTSNFQVRVGGRVDLFIKTAVTRSIIQVQVPTNTGGIVEIPPELGPVLKIHAAARVDALENIPLEFGLYDIRVTAPELRFTAEDTSTFYISPEEAGNIVSLDISHVPLITNINNFVNTPGIINGGDDALARFMVPAFVDISITVSGPDNIDALIRNSVAEYFVDLKQGLPIKSDELIQKLRQDVSEISTIYPDSMVLIVKQQSLDNLTEEILVEQDIVYPAEFPEQGITRNNVAFVLDNIDIVFV